MLNKVKMQEKIQEDCGIEIECSFAKAKKKICEFTVRQLSLIFGPDPKLFYGTFSRKLFKYLIFAFQCSFCCLMDHYFDKNKLNVTL